VFNSRRYLCKQKRTQRNATVVGTKDTPICCGVNAPGKGWRQHGCEGRAQGVVCIAHDSKSHQHSDERSPAGSAPLAARVPPRCAEGRPAATPSRRFLNLGRREPTRVNFLGQGKQVGPTGSISHSTFFSLLKSTRWRKKREIGRVLFLRYFLNLGRRKLT